MFYIEKHYGRYRYSKGPEYRGGGWVGVDSIPESQLYTAIGEYSCKASTVNESDAVCNKLFGLNFRLIAHTILMKCHFGKDHNGFYLCSNWDAQTKKRPKRYRPNGFVSSLMEDVLNGVEFIYPVEPHIIYICDNCKRDGIKSEWNWSFTAGLANSDYITCCPNCKLEAGGIFKQIENKLFNNERLKITTKWSHEKPFVWSNQNIIKPKISRDITNKLWMDEIINNSTDLNLI